MSQVVAEARKYLGTPWRHQGRSAEGIDCAGLIIRVANDLGIFSFDTLDYLPQATDESMMRLCSEHLEKGSMEPGCIPVMRFGNNRHIGIFGESPNGLTIIHAYSRYPRKVVEHLFSMGWLMTERAALLGIFRFKT